MLSSTLKLKQLLREYLEILNEVYANYEPINGLNSQKRKVNGLVADQGR